MKEKETCPHCGASMVEYKHGLSKGLLIGLLRLFEKGRPVNLKFLQLSRNQWDNFQKLRYWGLVEKYRVKNPNSDEQKGGVWTITAAGIDFCTGKLAVPRYVWTYRGDAKRFDGVPVKIADVDEGYRKRLDYAREAVPNVRVDGDGQLSLWGESCK